jgi:hypothetical protein
MMVREGFLKMLNLEDDFEVVGNGVLILLYL